jgi:chromosome segregation ATPase
MCENRTIQEEISRLVSEVKQLSTDKANLSQTIEQLETSRRQLEHASRENEEVAKQRELDLNTKVNQLTVENENLMNEKANLQQLLDETKIHIASLEEKHQSAVTALRHEIASLNHCLEESKYYRAEADRLTIQLANSNAENSQLKKEQEQLRKQLDDALHQNKSLECRLEEVTKITTSLSAEIDALTHLKQELEQKISETKDNNEAAERIFQTEKIKYEQEIECLKKELVQTKNILEETCRQKEEAILKIKDDLSQSFSLALANELQKQKMSFEQQINTLQKSIKEKTASLQEPRKHKTDVRCDDVNNRINNNQELVDKESPKTGTRQPSRKMKTGEIFAKKSQNKQPKQSERDAEGSDLSSNKTVEKALQVSQMPSISNPILKSAQKKYSNKAKVKTALMKKEPCHLNFSAQSALRHEESRLITAKQTEKNTSADLFDDVFAFRG